eukprot:gene38706-46887_t
MMAMSMMYGAEYEDDDEGDENEEAFHALLKESYLASLKTANSSNATEALMQRDVQMKLFNLMSGGSDLSDAKNGSEREKSLKEKRTNSKKMEAQFADIPQNLAQKSQAQKLLDFDGDDENDGVLGRKAPSEKGRKSDPVLQATTTAGSNSIKSESLSVPELVQKPVTEAVGNEKW